MSKARRLSAVLVILAAFVVVPTAQAQDTIQNPNESTPTTLYFHIFDTINRFVINTEPMDSEFFDVGGANFMTTPGTGIEGSSMTGWNLEDGYDMNTVYGYSTAGPVEYEFIENGKPRFHPERGIAATVDIDDSVDPIVYLYFDVRDAVGSESLAGTLPTFNVEITVQEGDNPGLDASLDEGKDIMTGKASFHMFDFSVQTDVDGTMCAQLIGLCEVCVDSTAIDCSVLNLIRTGTQAVPSEKHDFNDAAQGAESPDQKDILIPDENGIVEVAIPLEILQKTIPKKEAYNIRLDWYQAEEVFGEDEFTTGWLRLASDPEHLPRMELNVMNPVYFSFIHPQVAANTLLIHAGGNSPWGTYDVDLDAVTIEITHESGKKVPQNQLKKLLSSNEHVHGLHDQDAQLTFLWDFRENDAELGEYTIDMTLTNDAHSAVAEGSAKFIVSETEAIGVDTTGNVVEPSSTQGEEVDTPSAGIVPALGLLGAALFLARRRWTE